MLNDLFGPGTWGTGGNMVAWVICGAITCAAAFFMRHRVGRALSGWWAGHWEEHAVRIHKRALREHDEEKRRSAI